MGPGADRGVRSTGPDPSHGGNLRSNSRHPGVGPPPGVEEVAWRPLGKHKSARARAGGPLDEVRARLLAVTEKVGTSLKRGMKSRAGLGLELMVVLPQLVDALSRRCRPVETTSLRGAFPPPAS